MAETTFATNNPLTQKLYQEKLLRDVVKQVYWSRFMGNNPNFAVQLKTDLEGKQGDQIYYGLRMRLGGAGITGDGILEGNEEDLTTYSDSVVLEHYRHAVKDNGALTRQRAVFDVDEESELALKDWGQEKIDAISFAAILDTPSKVFFRNSTGVVTADSAANAKAGLHATNSVLNTVLLSALKTWAKTGGNRTYIPIRPLVVDGVNYYVLLTHPDANHDFVNDSTFQTAMREAKERSSENPLFRGSFAIWNGVVVHEHENCTIAADAGGGSNVAWAKSVFFGAQAMMFAFGQRPKLIEKNFDYENKHGKAWGVICRAKKPVFNSLDFGSVGVYCARTNISGL